MGLNHTNVIPENRFHPVQMKVFFTMISLYTFYFAANYNLGTAAKSIQHDFQISNAEFGVLFTIFTVMFGLGQFVAGFLGDRYSPKLLMVIGGFGATIANICFAFSNNMALFEVFWGLNALSLAMGWSPGCSILFRWIPPRRWGFCMGLFDAFAFLGGIIIYPIAGFAITYFSWRTAFIIPPVLLFIWTLVYIKIVKSTPEEAGYTVAWKNTTEESKGKANLGDYKNILKNPTLNLVSLVAVCSQFVRWGLVNWIIKILMEDTAVGGFGLTLVLAAFIASTMHWGGAFFSIGMGIVSDTVFKGSRWQTIFIGFMITAVSLALVFFFGPSILMISGGKFLLAALLFLAGGCVQGVQAPIFNLPGDLLGARLGGTGVGIVNGWSYIGASFSGVALGYMMDHAGLTSGILLMSGVSLAGALLAYVVRK